MDKVFSSNISRPEQVLRVLLSFALIATAYTPGFMPYWVALLAAYPAVTALTSWEPFYALVDAVKRRYAVSPFFKKELA